MFQAEERTTCASMGGARVCARATVATLHTLQAAQRAAALRVDRRARCACMVADRAHTARVHEERLLARRREAELEDGLRSSALALVHNCLRERSLAH